MEKISLKERFSYGLGDLACNLMFQLITAYLMFFYTDVAGIGLGAISLIMLVARVVDAVTDPMMGVIIDKTHTRWGKARPYVLWMAVPFGIISASMFLVPNFGGTGKFIYALITYILFCIVYTALNIPSSTMLSCMTDDVSDRLSFNMFKSLGASLGGFVVMGATLTLVAVFGQGDQKKGFFGTVVLYAVVGILLLMICFKNTKERIIPETEKDSVTGAIKVAVKNKYWLLLCGITFFTFAGMILKNQSTMYYAKYYLNNEGIASLLMTIPTLLSFLMAFIIPALAKKIGKRNCILSGGLVTIAGNLLVLISKTNLAGILAGTVLCGIGLGLGMGVTFVMGAETVDYSEWQTGRRPQGIMTALMGFGVKLSMAMSGVVGAQILKFGGYVENSVQTEGALRAIQMNFIWIPVIFFIVVVILSLFYDLDKKYEKILAEIHERRN